MNKISLSKYRELYFDSKKSILGEHHFVAVYLWKKFSDLFIQLKNPQNNEKIKMVE